MAIDLCKYCGVSLKPKRAAKYDFCTAKCERDFYYDEANYNGLRRSAVGFHERVCWICGRTPKIINVHHTFGRNVPTAKGPIDIDIYVVLCRGCHELVYRLSRRTFITDANRMADLITLARCERLLHNARTKVLIEDV